MFDWKHFFNLNVVCPTPKKMVMRKGDWKLVFTGNTLEEGTYELLPD